MVGRWVAVLACMGALAGCGLGQSRLNPLNLFGGSRAVAPVVRQNGAIIDTRPLMDQVIALSVAQTPDGAVVTATGLPATQGFYDGALIAVGDGTEGRLDYEFRAIPPPSQTRVSTQRSREIVVAVKLTDRQLAGISEIRVSGARSARSVRR